VTLALRSARRPLPPLPPAWTAFQASRGDDIALSLRLSSAPPVRPEDRLFESGGAWEVYRQGRGLLYVFSSPAADPPVYKAVAIDRGLRRGTLYWPAPHVGQHPLEFPLDELLFQHRFVRDGAVEVHSCAIEAFGKAWVFCGQSGAGKTTTARLWRRFRPETPILSDDRVVLRPRRGGIWAFGTPWHGTGGFHLSRGLPLGGLFFLEQAAVTRFLPLSAAAASARLFTRGFPPPWDARGLERALAVCERVAAAVPCHRFAFRKDRTAVEAVLALTAADPARIMALS
jgi:hypothetical protein